MGSRIMHYCISSLLSKELRIEDDQFFLGGIAPDVHKNMKEPKSKSHFVRTNSEGNETSDYLGFNNKYMNQMKEPFFLGYYYHLISDVIWVEDIYYKKIKWLPQPEKKEAQQIYYRDFWRLNGKLIDHYSLEFKTMKVVSNTVDEIDYRFLPELIKDLLFDFEMKDEAKEQELEILDFDEVIEVLQKSVRKCIDLTSLDRTSGRYL